MIQNAYKAMGEYTFYLVNRSKQGTVIGALHIKAINLAGFGKLELPEICLNVFIKTCSRSLWVS